MGVFFFFFVEKKIQRETETGGETQKGTIPPTVTKMVPKSSYKNGASHNPVYVV